MRAIVAVIIVVYLFLPPLCYANPCDSAVGATHGTYAIDGDSGSDSATDSDSDGCEASGCCADHCLSSFTWYRPQLATYPPAYSPHGYPDSVSREIYVPPRISFA
ncbi:hypothetical protein [Geomesophilobacter sediminis]|uniref:Secreted protein n=1 Tax=Geomesophilobacter sediminis TaxID=2798584 RepID=A0A8J7M0C8_9BACT|nr:hypothetical protein [Geomesophilobacter sediminis]MBJ6724512.1 hypothetical protein [Geomesophilobacter sediminis]